MKPSIAELPKPPSMNDHEYYRKLDLYLLGLYQFSKQLGDVIAWVEKTKDEAADSAITLMDAVSKAESDMSESYDKLTAEVKEHNDKELSKLQPLFLDAKVAFDNLTSKVLSVSADVDSVRSQTISEIKSELELCRKLLSDSVEKAELDLLVDVDKAKSDLEKLVRVTDQKLDQLNDDTLVLSKNLNDALSKINTVKLSATEAINAEKAKATKDCDHLMEKVKVVISESVEDARSVLSDDIDSVKLDNAALRSFVESFKSEQALLSQCANKELEDKLKEAELVLEAIRKTRDLTCFRGEWTSMIGVANPPLVVFHKGAYWNLLRGVRRIEAEEPKVSKVWVKL